MKQATIQTKEYGIIQLTRQQYDDRSLNISFYQYSAEHLTWKQRWYYFRRILRYGFPVLDEIVLSLSEVQELIDKLQLMYNISPDATINANNFIDEDYHEFLSGCVCHALSITRFNDRNEPIEVILTIYTHGKGGDSYSFWQKLKSIKTVLIDHYIFDDSVILDESDIMKFATILRNCTQQPDEKLNVKQLSIVDKIEKELYDGGYIGFFGASDDSQLSIADKIDVKDGYGEDFVPGQIKIEKQSIPDFQKKLWDKQSQVALRVSNILKEKGWTRKTLAEKMKVKESSLSRMLGTVGSNLSLETISKMEIALKASLLITPEEERYKITKDLSLATELHRIAMQHALKQ